jgi:hypothetical protein
LAPNLSKRSLGRSLRGQWLMAIMTSVFHANKLFL